MSLEMYDDLKHFRRLYFGLAALLLGYCLVRDTTETELWQSNLLLATLFIYLVARFGQETSTWLIFRQDPAGSVAR